MIVQQVKAIAITPTSPNVQAALAKAVKAGIKVVLIDNDIPGWTGKSSVVATDNLAGGKLAGEWLAKKLPAGAKLGILQGRLGNPSLDDRVKGLKSALGTGVSVVAEPATDCDQTKGLNAAQDLLTAHPDVNAIYGACGPPIIGALQAIKSAGKKPGKSWWSDLTRRRTSSSLSRRARRQRQSPSSRRRWARSASRQQSRPHGAKRYRPTWTRHCGCDEGQRRAVLLIGRSAVDGSGSGTVHRG
jgi:hypothetical protein